MAVNPITLLDGTTAYAADVETKVNPLYTDIDNSNIALAAGIVFSKLDSATVAGRTATQTLTNKTLTTPVLDAATGSVNGITGSVNGITGSVALTEDSSIAADKKLYLDGAAGDTYFIKNSGGSANTALFVDNKIDASFLRNVNGFYYENNAAAGASFFLAHYRGQDQTTFAPTVASNDNDSLGIFGFYGANDNATPVSTRFASIEGWVLDASDTTEDGQLRFRVQNASTEDTVAYLDGNGLLIDAKDPPAANYLNQNSGVKLWLNYADGSGSVANSYNVGSVTDDDGDGHYIVNIDTDFASNGLCVPVAIVGGAATDKFAKAWSFAATIEIDIYTSGGVLSDDDFYVIATGEQ